MKLSLMNTKKGGIMTIGESIRRQRKYFEFTLRELSELSGLSFTYLSDVETNKVNPSWKTVWEIAEALDTHVCILSANVDEVIHEPRYEVKGE